MQLYWGKENRKTKHCKLFFFCIISRRDFHIWDRQFLGFGKMPWGTQCKDWVNTLETVRAWLLPFLGSQGQFWGFLVVEVGYLTGHKARVGSPGQVYASQLWKQRHLVASREIICVVLYFHHTQISSWVLKSCSLVSAVLYKIKRNTMPMGWIC